MRVLIGLLTVVMLLSSVACAPPTGPGRAAGSSAPAPAARPAAPLRVVSLLDPASPRAGFLADLGLPVAPGGSLAAVLSEKQATVVIADGSAATLAELVGARDALGAFTARGGWLMLWGVTPEGLASFNSLVGVQHLLRPFVTEELHLPDPPSSLLAGLDRDSVLMLSDRRGRFGGQLRDDAVWSYVFDDDDIAPFASLPAASHWGVDGSTEPGFDRHPPNLVNGLYDSWMDGFTFSTNRSESLAWHMDFPRRETVTRFSIVCQDIYRHITGIRLSFSGSAAAPLDLAIPPTHVAGLRQDFAVPAIPATGMTVAITGMTTTIDRAEVASIGNLWITVARPPEFHHRVHPLLSLGVLNCYPQGAGGLIANQLRIDAQTSTLNRGKQKDILATLLRHLREQPRLADSPTAPPATALMIPRSAYPDAVLVDDFRHAAEDTDDTMAIRRAIDAALQQGIRTVAFRARTYHVSGQTVCSGAHHLTLRGEIGTDGMPATILEEQLSESTSSIYEHLVFFGGSDIAVRNFAFSCSKPVAMVATIVATGPHSVTIEPLPRYRDATDLSRGRWPNEPAGPDNSFAGFHLFDLDAGHQRAFIPVKKPFRMVKVPGSTRWRTEGLEEDPDVYVGEHITWDYQCAWFLGGVHFNTVQDPTAENLLGLNFPGSQAEAAHCTGVIRFKDLYSVPYDGWYTTNRASHNYIDYGPAEAINDHVVQVTSARDDSYDEDFIGYSVMEIINDHTFKVRGRSNTTWRPQGEFQWSMANDEVWLMNGSLPRPCRCRLLVRPTAIPPTGPAQPDVGWFLVTVADPLPAEALQPTPLAETVEPTFASSAHGSWILLPRFFAVTTTMRHCVDFRNGSGHWHHHSSFLSENNIGLAEDYSPPEVGDFTTCIVRNNEYIQSERTMLNAGIAIYDTYHGGAGTASTCRITNNIFANVGSIGPMENVKGAVIESNAWVGAPRIQIGANNVDIQVLGNHHIAEDPAVNALSNDDVASGALSPWQVELGSASVGADRALHLAPGYDVLRATITHLRPNTYYRWGGRIAGDALSFKVTGFAPFGCAIIAPALTEPYLTFRTFPGITSATLVITRRGGHGEAVLDQLALRPLQVAIPPEESAIPPGLRLPPLPEDDGTYHLLDDADPALAWSGAWESYRLDGESLQGQLSYADTLHVATSPGSRMSLTFTGTGVGLYAVRRGGYGALSVRVDDRSADVVELGTANDEQQLVHTVTGLSAGTHTLTVTSIDARPVNIDAVRIWTGAR